MKAKLLLLSLFLIYIVSLSRLQAQGPKGALQFDGADDYVFFDYNNRGITSEVTVEAWVKTSASKLQLITAKYDRDGERGYQLVMRDGKAAFSGRDGSGTYRISGYSPRVINDDNWHHLAGVCKNGTWSIYIDGILESQSVTGYTAVNLSSNAPFTVGNYYLVNSDYYQGQIDELKIWKKGLTEDEIRSGMCQAANKANPDLVVYLKFDEGPGATLTDHSSYGINGTFRNMSSSAWVTSGAPIGDKSIYRYTNKWNNSLELITDFANFSVSRADNAIAGFHLYQITAAPSQAAGLPSAVGIKEYYGLFKIGAPDKKYKIWFKQYDLPCGEKLYRRNNNADTNWTAVADTVNSPVMTYHSTANYGEFAAARSSNQSSDLLSEYVLCNGKAVMLKSPKAKNATYLWSTGETTASISTSTLGTYTVTVTTDGCSTVYTMVVTNSECPTIPNVITPNGDGKNDAFVLGDVEPFTFELKIFNRWGKSIYQSERYDNGWSADGVPAGLYFYNLKSSRSQNMFKGWLEVIK
ncbi:LamG-like jellyroll fold domain-containing protein [Pontibacter cellulosilyticus]|uniref:Gliding motility-associated C-terminal domain-containing protein n=1 Tax=Pontibacter cellulosilyticus TaxID=1720253 RepID=A0A923N7Z8_9BACT|nr:LamG-like jellyroll fold domain-containing protein [Pontibacter cellulosilyticus]MBC5992150.1 gliding motility-associated C-terminal domain-containing protein [Pontibacter cellulosilyticus]